MRTIDLQFLKDTLEELDPELKGDDGTAFYRGCVVLLAALRLGPDVDALADLTGYGLDFVATIGRRMLEAELWTEADICCDHWFTEDGQCYATAFWADTLVAEGLVFREWSEEEGDYRYRAIEFARPSLREVTPC